MKDREYIPHKTYLKLLIGGGLSLSKVLLTNPGDFVCYNHAISADGWFVAYEVSRAPGASPAYPGLILRYSMDPGTTELVHTNAAVQPPVTVPDIRNLAITPDGQKIVFVASTNGTSGTNTCILLWDAATGAATLVSADRNGQVPANSTCDWPAIDTSGRFVAFSSTATNLTTNTLTGEWHLYLRDLQTGVTTLLDADVHGAGSPVGPFGILHRLAHWCQCGAGPGFYQRPAGDRNLHAGAARPRPPCGWGRWMPAQRY